MEVHFNRASFTSCSFGSHSPEKQWKAQRSRALGGLIGLMVIMISSHLIVLLG